MTNNKLTTPDRGVNFCLPISDRTTGTAHTPSFSSFVTAGQDKIRATNKAHACEKCGKTNGNCRYTDSLTLCHYHHGRKSDIEDGLKCLGLSKDGRLGLWVEASAPKSNYYWQELSYRQQESSSQSEQAKTERSPSSLSVEERDRYYHQLLAELTLHPADRADLLRRGFSDEDIVALGIKSVVRYQPLKHHYPANLPGVSSWGNRLIVNQAGYVWPVVNAEGYIVGLQLRVRGAHKNKSRWLSTNGNFRLPSGEMPLQHVQGQTRIGEKSSKGLETPWLVFAESVMAKPVLIAKHLRCLVLGASGGMFGNSEQQVIAATKEALERGHIPVLASDAGSFQNWRVVKQYWELADIVAQILPPGEDLMVAWYGQSEKIGGNDPDEVSAETLRSAQLIPFSTALKQLAPRHVFQRVKHLRDSQMPLLSRLLTQVFEPSVVPQKSKRPSQSETVDVEYERGDRHITYKQLIDQGYRYILELSNTGTGKSWDAGNVEPSDFDMQQVIYASADHRNPSTPTLTQENGWIDLEARHNGLVRDEKGKLRRSNAGEPPVIRSNCNRTRLAATLRAKNVAGSDTADRLCGGCPLKEACQHSAGYGFGFLNQRKETLTSGKLRAHPDSLPDPSDYDYTETLMLWEEAGASFGSTREIKVYARDVKDTLSRILTHCPDEFTAIQPLLTWLLQIFSGDIKTGLYGLKHEQIKAAIAPFIPNDAAVAAIRAVLHPDQELNSLLNPTAQYGEDLTNLPKSVRQRFATKDIEAADTAEDTILKQWLPMLIDIVNGNSGHLHINSHHLTLTLPDLRHRQVAQAASANIFMDATLSREQLALQLGCSPEEIAVVKQRTEATQNLAITQIYDLGRLGQQRGNEQERRVNALKHHYTSLPGTTYIIDFKKFEAEGAWWRDSRGVNDFQDADRLVLVGTPCRNLATLEAEYHILTGRSPLDDQGTPTEAFTTYVDTIILADIHQAIGRIRAHQRPDIPLEVIIVSGFALDIEVQSVKASDITPDAASHKEQMQHRITEAVSTLMEQGIKVTQTAVAKAVGISQATISRFYRKLLQSLLIVSNSSGNNLVESDFAEVAEWAIAHSTTPIATADAIWELFVDWSHPRQWPALFRTLSTVSQHRVLVTLLAMLPPEEMSRVEMAVGKSALVLDG